MLCSVQVKMTVSSFFLTSSRGVGWSGLRSAFAGESADYVSNESFQTEESERSQGREVNVRVKVKAEDLLMSYNALVVKRAEEQEAA